MSRLPSWFSMLAIALNSISSDGNSILFLRNLVINCYDGMRKHRFSELNTTHNQSLYKIVHKYLIFVQSQRGYLVRLQWCWNWMMPDTNSETAESVATHSKASTVHSAVHLHEL